jgi:HSP20 family molecular chaperone IbpA
MWSEACERLERAERLHRQYFQLGRVQARGPAWEPPIDVFETAHELWILAALPGVGPENLQILIDSGMLIIAGERPLPAELRSAGIVRMELPRGRFERRIELPARPFELGRRELRNGCLILTLRKR